MQPGETKQPNQEGAQNSNQSSPAGDNAPPQRQYVQYGQDADEQSFVYTGNAEREDQNQNGIEEITWQASEYISHQKTAAWYAVLIAVGAGLVAGVYLLLNDIASALVIALGLLAFAVYGSRKPGVLQYRVDENGVMIDEKSYSFDRFRSFAVSQDHGIPTIVLYPTQRFLPPLSLYCAPDDFNQIATTISAFLPETEHKPDLVERMMARLRF